MTGSPPELDEAISRAINRGQVIEAMHLSESRRLVQYEHIWSEVKCHLDQLERFAAETASEFHLTYDDVSHEISEREMQIRCAISDQFHQLQIQHISDLLGHEKEQLLKFAREQIRPVKAVQSRHSQARIASSGKDFDTAVNLAEQAKLREVPELRRREAVVRTEFLIGRAEMIERQK
jgi:hypothetical protein